ncbi:hypothetical protein H735_09270 [Vibrio owensii CAIM 1854 = LMG 25443]|uniref:Uncharacterized protein n=3 Tax=Vibrio TaxID=662 RepID=A0AAU9QRN6_9VIBR|nr:hypothetical protein H735_09270 [Vibrio owensii CAIM 1854 = LMG 25443]POB46969.1 hypothetical protein CRN52_12895 [Vibrio vulnificus]CAH1590098.1 conserved hypothetical protein [Vibrio jasicida]CAH1599335.1 conserved hypothetical protein [Vibrio jasicida]
MNCQKVIVVALNVLWLSLMSFCLYKFATIPELSNAKLITEQVKHYYPYSELALALMFVALCAIVVVMLFHRPNRKSSNAKVNPG